MTALSSLERLSYKDLLVNSFLKEIYKMESRLDFSPVQVDVWLPWLIPL